MEIYWYTTFALLIRFIEPLLGSEKTAGQDNILKCIPTGERKPNAKVRKSEHDERQYKYLTLENKLRILLVSDPRVEISAASVSVHAGYARDPPAIPGLAHFLEHMLFLGTEKYPDEDDFINLLGQHGGQTNAYTSMETTLYYFDIESEYLHQALDRFSQFFVAPLLNTSFANREILAIDQEHKIDYSDDEWTIHYIKREGSRRGHPYGRFGTGSSKTLRTISQRNSSDIQKILLDFYYKYYSANIMTLALIGKESLEDLENMVVPLFRKVKNQDTLLTSYMFPYGEKQLATMLKIPTTQDMNRLEIEFQLPDLRCFFRTKPLKYFSQAIMHEEKGSLSSHLKNLDWANSVTVGNEAELIGFEFLVIEIDLTQKGLARVDDIITLLFQYLKMIRETPIQKWIHDEMRELDLTKFLRQDEKESYQYAVELSENMQKYEAEHVIDGEFITGELRMTYEVSQLLQYFSPDNFRYYVASNTFKGPWNKRAKYYDRDYSEHKIPKWKLMKWRNVTANPKLYLPLKNPFVPDPKELKIIVPRTNKTVKDVPVIIKDNQMVRVWHKADDIFYSPETAIIIGVYSPNPVSTPSKLNHLVLFIDLVRDAMKEFEYAAELAGITYHIKSRNIGIVIELYSFSSKQDVFLRKLLNHVVSIKHTMKEEEFNARKQKLREELNNGEMQVPFTQAEEMRRNMVTETWWDDEERLRHMHKLTMNSLKQYIENFLQNIYVEGGFSGNMLSSTALSIFSVVEGLLVKKTGAGLILPIQHLRTREYKLKEGSSYLFEKRSSVYSFSLVWIYFQVGLQTEMNNVLCELLNQMIYEQIFQTLKIKEQLGHIVDSGIPRSQSVLGIGVLVQSYKQPSYIKKRIATFFESFLVDLQNMPEEKFKDYVKAAAAMKLNKPVELCQEAKTYALESFRRQFHFRRADKEVELLWKLKKSDMIEFFERHFNPASDRQKKLAVVILGKNAKSINEELEADWTVIDDILQFKASLPLYEHVLPYNNIPLFSYNHYTEKEEL